MGTTAQYGEHYAVWGALNKSHTKGRKNIHSTDERMLNSREQNPFRIPTREEQTFKVKNGETFRSKENSTPPGERTQSQRMSKSTFHASSY